MPIYEYEPIDWDCLICQGRFEVLQGIHDPNLKECPTCGLPCRRLVSRAQVKVVKYLGQDHAGKKGFTMYKRAEKGVWERVSGEGVDAIVGAPEDIAAVEAEKASTVKKVDLDANQ